MDKAYPHTKPGVCLGVEIFAIGHFQDRDWNVADLIEIAVNTAKWSHGPNPILATPMIALGHEKDEENRKYVEALLKRTDLPKTGDVVNYRVKGDPYREACGHEYARLGCPDCEKNALLVADFLNVAPPIASIINRRAFDRVSSEIYDPLRYDGRVMGLCLRAVALLGGDLPAVKTLADIPMVVPMPERGKLVEVALPRRNAKAAESRQVVIPMSDLRRGPKMKREQIIQDLGKAGFDTSTITADVPESVLVECLRLLNDKPRKQPESATAEFADRREVESFYRSHADRFKKVGMSEEDFVNGLKLARRREPGMTAKAFCQMK